MKRIILFITVSFLLMGCGKVEEIEDDDRCMTVLLECHEVLEAYEELTTEQKKVIESYRELLDKLTNE